MQTIIHNKKLSPQLLTPNLPGTVFQAKGQGLFFDEETMNRVRIFSPVASPDSSKFYPYYFNVDVSGDVDNTKSRSLAFDLQIKDPAVSTKLTKLVGEVTPALVIDGANSSENKAQIDLYQDDDASPDVLAVVVGQQNSLTSYGMVIYIRGGMEITGFSTANTIVGVGSETVETTFGGVAFPAMVDTVPNATFNRKNIVKFVGSGQYNTLNKLFEVDQLGNATALSVGGEGGSGSGITPPIISDKDTLGIVGEFHLMDLRAGGLVFTLPDVANDNVKFGDIIRVGDYFDSAELMNPLVITSNEPIHGETDPEEKPVYLFKPGRVVWQYQGSEVGWYCVDGIGEGSDFEVPEIEVLIAKDIGSTTGTLPGDYEWSDFVRIDLRLGNKSNSSITYGISSVHESAILAAPEAVNLSCVGGDTSGNVFRGRIQATGKNTWSTTVAGHVNTNIRDVVGIVKYKPVLERPKRKEVLFHDEVNGKTDGEKVPLAEPMTKYDFLAITYRLNSTRTTYRTRLVEPSELLRGSDYFALDQITAEGSSSSYALIEIDLAQTDDQNLHVYAKSVTYNKMYITKVVGVNFMAQNIITGGSGGGAGISPPELKTTNFDVEFNKSYAVDMSDDITKTAKVPAGMLNDQWFTITAIRANDVDLVDIIIDTPFNTWGYGDGTSKRFKFPARSNATYTVQMIDGQLFIIGEAGVGNEFVPPVIDDNCYIWRNGKWEPLYKDLPTNPLQGLVPTELGLIPEVNVSNFGNFTSSYKWFGGVLAKNGKIYGIPYNASTVLEVDVANGTALTFGNVGSATGKYYGGTLADDGLIYCTPSSTANILVIDPIDKTTETFGTVVGNDWHCLVLGPDGKLYGIPYGATEILEIDPELRTTTTFGSVTNSGSGWTGGVLAPNGLIYCLPVHAGTILVIDPINKTTRTFGEISGGYQGGALLSNGKIYAAPYNNAAEVLIIDPTNDSFKTIAIPSGDMGWLGTVIGSNGKAYSIPYNAQSILEIDPADDTFKEIGSYPASGNKWAGGVLGHDGSVYGIPASSVSVLKIDPGKAIPDTFWGLSPYVNKL